MVSEKESSLALQSAKAHMERGDYKAAERVLRPLVEVDEPEALFLVSTFSVAGSESAEEFERRSFEMLKRSAELGYPKAMLALARCYAYGDLVGQDTRCAQEWLQRAKQTGFPFEPEFDDLLETKNGPE